MELAATSQQDEKEHILGVQRAYDYFYIVHKDHIEL